MGQDISGLKGVGEKVADKFKRLGIETVEDLLNHTPRRYKDFSRLIKLGNVKPGELSAQVKVTNVSSRYLRRGLHITQAVLEDNSGKIKAVWFNQPYRAKQFSENQEYFVSGNLEFKNQSYSMVNPSLEKVSDFPKNTARIVPIYKETKGLKSHTIRKIIAELNIKDLDIDDKVPFKTEISRKDAFSKIHFPQSSSDIQQAQAFFSFEELYAVILASALVKKQNAGFVAQPSDFNKTKVKKMVESLSFTLTDDQKIAAWQCFQDMKKKHPMNRLLEGDVGSGKTIVASLIAYNAILNHQQVAFMVPTEVLAMQHFTNISALLEPLGVKVGYCVGSLKKSSKDVIYKSILAGEIDIVIGTHALIQDKVAFKNLNLIIIDEQHRFGVDQRTKLIGKAKSIPHVLTMTATPIPRTLRLTVLGDLDISIIKQMPAGRIITDTKIISPNSLKPMFKLIADQVNSGRQAFMIYPLVEESEQIESLSATEAYKKLSKTTFKDFRLALIHGRIKAKEKDKIMTDFSQGNIDILISTTVVEGGVDITHSSVVVT